MKRKKFFKNLFGLMLIPFIPKLIRNLHANDEHEINAHVSCIGNLSKSGKFYPIDATMAERAAIRINLELEQIGYDPSLEAFSVRKVCRTCGIITTCHLGYDDELYQEQESEYIKLYNNKNFKCLICREYKKGSISESHYKEHLEDAQKNIQAWKNKHSSTVLEWHDIGDVLESNLR